MMDLRCTRVLYGFFIVLIAFTVPTTALAQAEIHLPPTADTQSATGVSFKTGGFQINGIEDLSIGGPGIAGLRLVRSYASTNDSSLSALTGAQGWAFNTRAAIVRNLYSYSPDEIPPAPHLMPLMYTVMTGTNTSRFRGGTVGNGTSAWVPTTGPYIPQDSNGETLVFTKIGTGSPGSGSYFTFTDATGAVFFYPYTTDFPVRLQSVTYADGTRLDYSSRTIISNRGYALLWENANKVCVINMAETYVTSATTTCPPTAQAVTYAFGTGPYESGGGNIVGVTNALGQTTTYSYVGFNHMGCIKDPGQTVCRISNTYSVCMAPPPPPTGPIPPNRLLDQVTSQITGTGETYSYTYLGYTSDLCNDYTGYGVTATMTAPGSATSTIYTNGAGAVTGITDPLGRNTSIAYDDTRSSDPYQATMLWQTWYQDGNKFQFLRDSRGNVIEKRGVAKPSLPTADIVMTASYPATCSNRKTCNKPDYIIDARGNRTDFTYDSNHGGTLTETGPAAPNGIRPQKRYSYTQLYAWIRDSSGGFVQASSPVWMLTGISECMTQSSCAGTADEIKTTFTYGTPGTANNLLPTDTSVSAGDNSLVATTTRTYDFSGNVLTVDGPLSGAADTTRYRYDALRHVVGEIGPDPDAGGSLLHRAIRNTYDAAGRLTKVERGTVNSQSDGDWAAFAPLESLDSAFDVMHRKIKESKSGGGTTYAVTQFSYDASGSLECTAVRMDPAQWSSQTNACVPQTTGPYGPDRVSRNIYNLAGERVTLKLGVGTSVESDEESSTYTGNGKLSTITDGENNRTTYEYDGHDRLRKTRYPDPDTKGVSSSSIYEQLTYDANGNTTQRRLRDGQVINFAYDNLNRMSLKDLPVPETDVTYNSYDLQGHLLSVSQDINISATWDALGRQRTEVSPLGTMTFNYDEAGRRTKTTWPSGIFVTQDYYDTNEVKRIYEGSSTLAFFEFDNRGNRLISNRGNGSRNTYVPDAISRLVSMGTGHQGSSYDSTSTFTYNPASQIATYSRTNDLYAWGGHFNVNDSYAINGLNQVTSAGSKSVGHDGRGNITSIGSDAYTYTAENRLITGPGGATLQYDPLGRLYQISKAGLTTRFQYDGTDLVAEYDGTNALQRRYVHGPGFDEPVVWYEGNGTSDRRYYLQDERGSVVAISDSTALPIALKTYDEYGVPGGNSTVGRFAYTGQTWLPEIGLYYYKARMYSPTLGRFMQTDPSGYKDGINWYSYVGNDPLNRKDPTGLQTVEPPALEELQDQLDKEAKRPEKPGIDFANPPRDDDYNQESASSLHPHGLTTEGEQAMDKIAELAEAGEELNNATDASSKQAAAKRVDTAQKRYYQAIDQALQQPAAEPAPQETIRIGSDGQIKGPNAEWADDDIVVPK